MIDPRPEPFLPEELSQALEDLAPRLAALRRGAAVVASCAETWDMRQLRQRLPGLQEALADASEALRSLEGALGAFRAPDSGPEVLAYVGMLKEKASQMKVDLKGQYPDFEAFPLELHVDLAGEQVRISKRQLTALKPDVVVRALQKEQTRLHRSAFHAERFMRMLAAAYDLLRLKRPQSLEVRLADIYRLLTLRTGSGDYTKQAFAFDIYRLRRETDLIHEGRMFQFGHGRQAAFGVPNGRGGTDNLASLALVEVEVDG